MLECSAQTHRKEVEANEGEDKSQGRQRVAVTGRTSAKVDTVNHISSQSAVLCDPSAATAKKGGEAMKAKTKVKSGGIVWG